MIVVTERPARWECSGDPRGARTGVGAGADVTHRYDTVRLHGRLMSV